MIDWETIYWQQTPRLFNFFRYRTGDSNTAQDLTAQTLERAWRYRHKYRRDVGAFEAWLFQIARNVAMDHLRARAPVQIPLYELYDLASEYSLEGEVQQRENARQLYALLSQLSQKEQEIIALKYGAEMTNRQIARLIDLTESNVGTILHRIIKRLRLEWELSYE